MKGRTLLATPCKVKLRRVAACTLAQDAGGGAHAERRRRRQRGFRAYAAAPEIVNLTRPDGFWNSGGLGRLLTRGRSQGRKSSRTGVVPISLAFAMLKLL